MRRAQHHLEIDVFPASFGRQASRARSSRPGRTVSEGIGHTSSGTVPHSVCPVRSHCILPVDEGMKATPGLNHTMRHDVLALISLTANEPTCHMLYVLTVLGVPRIQA